MPVVGQQHFPQDVSTPNWNSLEVITGIEEVSETEGLVSYVDQQEGSGVIFSSSQEFENHCDCYSPVDSYHVTSGVGYSMGYGQHLEQIDLQETASHTQEDSVDSTHPVVSVTTPEGTVIHVYDDCVMGSCDCIHYIGDVRAQLKPCRFASVICDEINVWASKCVGLLNSITDGFEIVQGSIQSYECSNYRSILETRHKSPDGCNSREGVARRCNF